MRANMTGGAGRHNQLLVIYYQGHERYSEKDGVYWTTFRYLQLGHKQDVIECSRLEASLQRNCPGARLILLDVAGAPNYPEMQAWETIRFYSWADSVALLRLLEPSQTAAAGRLLDAWAKASPQARRLKQLTDKLESILQNPSQSQPQPFQKMMGPPLNSLPVAGEP
jgi:hypothetical protein